MVNAHLDTLELELRKLDGVRTVGFSSQHDILYIQLFVDSANHVSSLPFEATKIAQRHSSSPVAVELVRWTSLVAPKVQKSAGINAFFPNENLENQLPQSESKSYSAGSISVGSTSKQNENVEPEVQETAPSVGLDIEETNDIREEPSDFDEPEEFVEEEAEEPTTALLNYDLDEEELNEVDLALEESHDQPDLTLVDDQDERREDNSIERIALLLVTTSAQNDEIEVHLSFDETRTIGRAPTNRGLLGAIDATVNAIAELTGNNEFHAEWARSLEPGAEHASLVAVGLTNAEGTDTRHGIAGGSSPIEAAARATLNALNRTAVLSLNESEV